MRVVTIKKGGELFSPPFFVVNMLFDIILRNILASPLIQLHSLD
jgi:ribosomal protein L11 methylase PrmA